MVKEEHTILIFERMVLWLLVADIERVHMDPKCWDSDNSNTALISKSTEKCQVTRGNYWAFFARQLYWS